MYIYILSVCPLNRSKYDWLVAQIFLWKGVREIIFPHVYFFIRNSEHTRSKKKNLHIKKIIINFVKENNINSSCITRYRQKLIKNGKLEPNQRISDPNLWNSLDRR